MGVGEGLGLAADGERLGEPSARADAPPGGVRTRRGFARADVGPGQQAHRLAEG